MSVEEREAMEVAGQVFVGLVLIVLSAAVGLLWAHVLQEMWRWFVIPVFASPRLPFWSAYGLLLIGGVFTHNLARSKATDEDSDGGWMKRALTKSVESCITALLAWGIAAIAAGFAQ